MKRRHVLTIVVAMLFLLMLSLAIGVAAQNGAGHSSAGADSQPVGPPEVVIPERYRPTGAAPAGDTGATEFYFTPQDENTSVTLIFLYNTSAVDAVVTLQTFQLDGSLLVDQDLNVPANELVRIATDEVSTLSISWQEVVYVNFLTLSTYARLTVPKGVQAEAYVAWNGATGIFDPLDAVPTLSLRFSTDPATIFLPAIERN